MQDIQKIKDDINLITDNKKDSSEGIIKKIGIIPITILITLLYITLRLEA